MEKIILIVFMISIHFINEGQEDFLNNCVRNDNIVSYENYLQSIEVPNLSSIKKLGLNSNQNVITDTIDVRNYKIVELTKVSGDLFDFLASQEVFFDWEGFRKEYFGQDKYDERLKEWKKNVDIYFLTHQKFSESFESYFFILSENHYPHGTVFYTQYLIMINIKDNILLSMVNLSIQEHLPDLNIYVKSKMINKTTIEIFKKRVEGGLYADKIECSKFKINKSGYLEFINK